MGHKEVECWLLPGCSVVGLGSGLWCGIGECESEFFVWGFWFWGQGFGGVGAGVGVGFGGGDDRGGDMSVWGVQRRGRAMEIVNLCWW